MGQEEISAGKLLRQMGKQRASTEGALQDAAMRAVGQGTSDSARAALPQWAVPCPRF